MTTATSANDLVGKAAAPGPSRQTRWFRRVLVAVVTLAVVAGACAGYWWAEVQTYHFSLVVPGRLYRCGNRGMREFDHAVKQCGARTVVSFISDQELNDPAKPWFQEEAEYCRAHGIRQIRIPVPLGGWPTTDQVLKFLNIVAEPGNRPVLMHCAQGVRRTGMFMAAYQLSQLDRTIAVTKERIMPFGHKGADIQDINTFIDTYDPATATVPSNLHAVSHE